MGAGLSGDGLGPFAPVRGEQAARTQSPSPPLNRDLTLLDTTIRGAMRLRGGPWEVEIRPQRGGRITSLCLAGEELLDQGIGVDDPSVEDFVGAGAWGWDEMVPNIEAARYPGPGPFEGVELPDHGEAWRVPWTASDERTMEATGRVLPWKLLRRIALTDSMVRIEYVFTNVGNDPVFAYWCSHALFRYEEDMEVDVGRQVAQPGLGESRKVFLRRGSADRALLRWKSGAAIELSWDSAVTPYVGVWICNGDLGGYRQIAIEPATGGGDRPHLAVPPPLLNPGEQLQWWLAVKDARSP